MNGSFPGFRPYKDTGRFRFWSNKVLPTVYDDALSYYEVLNKVVTYLNDVIENLDTVEDNLEVLAETVSTQGSDIATLKSDVAELKTTTQEISDSLSELRTTVTEDHGALMTVIAKVNILAYDVENLLENAVDKDTLERTAFVPQAIGGEGAQGYLYNTGSSTPDTEEYIFSNETGWCGISSDFDTSEGNYPSCVFIPLYNSNAHCRLNSEKTIAYLLIDCPDQGFNGEVLFSDGHNLDSGYKAVGMNFDAQSGMNVIEVKPRITHGDVSGTTPINYIGFKFNTTGNKYFNFNLVFYEPNALEQSVAASYTKALSKFNINLNELNFLTEVLDIPQQELADGEKYYLYAQRNGDSYSIGWELQE